MAKIVIVVRGKMIVISGCPRSGTSLCMDAHRNMYGEDKIMGSGFLDDDPDEIMRKNQQAHLESINHPGQRMAIEYMMSRADDRFPQRKEARENRRQRKKEARDMNPNGFWEHPFTVNGIQYQPGFREELQESLETPKILKVVSQGLMASDPIYIDKIVYMLRHPRAVAKSQERLQREEFKGKDKLGRRWDLMERFIIHTPEMFINVSLSALQFFIDNPGISVKIVQYEDLVADPDKVIQSIYDFNGLKGDVEAGKATVDTKLNRSEHQDIENILWDESEYIYEAMIRIQKLFDKGAKHKEIVKVAEETLEYMSDPLRENSILNQKWYCLRAKIQVNAADCELCMSCFEHRENLREQSETKLKEGERNWVDEPCLFEVGMDVKRKKYVSIEDSIFINWWRKPALYPLEEMRAQIE